MMDEISEREPVYRGIESTYRSSSDGSGQFSSLDAESSVPPLPPGGYVEPHSSFRIAGVSDKLLGTSLDILQNSLDCECSFEIALFRIRGSYYNQNDGTETKFFVTLFSREQDDAYTMEFQKRKGDSQTFYDIYRKFQFQLMAAQQQGPRQADRNAYSFGSKNSSSNITVSETAQTLQALSLPDLSALSDFEMEAPSDAENSVMIRGLLNMAQSSYHEIQQEGICSLVQVASSCDGRCADCMEAEGVMTFFLQQLKPSSQPSSTKDELQRSCVSGIANLLRCQNVARKFCSERASYVSLFELGHHAATPRRTKREVLRALNAFAPSVSADQAAEYQARMDRFLADLPSDIKEKVRIRV